jgi:stage III sporulation protein AG
VAQLSAQEEKQSRMEQKSEAGKKDGLVAGYKKLDTKKKIQFAAILLIVIVILAIYFTSVSGNRKQENSGSAGAATVETQISSASIDDAIAQRLQETLSAIEGAGRVEVMITYESTAELVPAFSVDRQSSTKVDESTDGKSTTSSENTQSEVVTISGSDGTQALVLKENSPPIKGVIVVAEGADDIRVRLDLLSAVQTILNIGPDQVNVYKMNIE